MTDCCSEIARTPSLVDKCKKTGLWGKRDVRPEPAPPPQPSEIRERWLTRIGPGTPFLSGVPRKPVKVCNVKADQNPGTQVFAAWLEWFRAGTSAVYRTTTKLAVTRIITRSNPRTSETSKPLNGE